MNIQKILKEIDISKTETKYVDIEGMCGSEFKIYEFLNQTDDNIRLNYCYYHRWICTDTEVGIRVWYFDGKPVCLSWKPYRKSSESFGWISEKDFEAVKNYCYSLKADEDFKVNIINDDLISDVINEFNKIDYKSHEKRNVIIVNEIPEI